MIVYLPHNFITDVISISYDINLLMILAYILPTFNIVNFLFNLLDKKIQILQIKLCFGCLPSPIQFYDIVIKITFIVIQRLKKPQKE